MPHVIDDTEIALFVVFDRNVMNCLINRIPTRLKPTTLLYTKL